MKAVAMPQDVEQELFALLDECSSAVVGGVAQRIERGEIDGRIGELSPDTALLNWGISIPRPCGCVKGSVALEEGATPETVRTQLLNRHGVYIGLGQPLDDYVFRIRYGHTPATHKRSAALYAAVMRYVAARAQTADGKE